jgi:hypothetical protein
LSTSGQLAQLPRETIEPAPQASESADKASEAAKAVARARAAAAARLRDVARAAAQQSAAPVEAPVRIAPKRRAKPDLQEQPSVAGEVEVLRKEVPPLLPGQVVVSPDADLPLTPLSAEALQGPSTRQRTSPVLVGPGAAGAPWARDPAVPLVVKDRERSVPPQGATQLLPINRQAPVPEAVPTVPSQPLLPSQPSAPTQSQPPLRSQPQSFAPAQSQPPLRSQPQSFAQSQSQPPLPSLLPSGRSQKTVPGVVDSAQSPTLKSDRITIRNTVDPEKDRRTELVEVIPIKPPEEPVRTPLRALALFGALATASLLAAVLVPRLSHPPVPVTSPGAGTQDVALLLGRIDRSIDVEDWHAALVVIGEAIQHNPQSSALLDRKRRVEAELRNQLRYESFRGAVERHNDEAALALFAEIPGESLYKQRASSTAERIRETYISGKLMDARAARRIGACREVRRLLQAVLAIDGANEEARAMEGRCERRLPKEERETDSNGLRNPFPPVH